MYQDLSNAKVSQTELNPLAYSPGDYPGIDTLLSFIGKRRQVKTIDLMALSKNGKLVKDTIDDYLKKSDYNSSSALKEVLKSPLHYYYCINQVFKQKPTRSFDLGTFAHRAFLEPELFNMVVAEPIANRASKDGVFKLIKFYWDLNKVDPGKRLVNIETGMNELKLELSLLETACRYDIINEDHKIIIDVLKKHYNMYGGGIIPEILKGAEYETSFYGADESTGLKVRVRPDAFNIAENIGVNAIISFKTTAADSLDKFYYDAAKYKYELTEGMYQKVVSEITGRKFNVTIMIMLQTVPPYAPAVFWWDADDLQNGKYKYDHALSVVADCKLSGLYPGYDAMAEDGNFGIINMKLPEWSLKEIHPVDIPSRESVLSTQY